MNHPTFQQKWAENRIKSVQAEITWAEPPYRNPFLLCDIAANARERRDRRELSELPVTPACCEVQEDAALTRIHHSDNCEVRFLPWQATVSTMVSAPNWYSKSQSDSNISPQPFWISSLIKATVHLWCHNPVAELLRAAILWTSWSGASWVVEALLKRQANVLVNKVWRQSGQIVFSV